MKYTLVFFTLMLAVGVYSLPAPMAFENGEPGPEPESELEEDLVPLETEPHTGEHTRFKRATCDLFSFSSKWLTPNHAACAAHCLAKGYKGGFCKNTVCHCRR